MTVCGRVYHVVKQWVVKPLFEIRNAPVEYIRLGCASNNQKPIGCESGWVLLVEASCRECLGSATSERNFGAQLRNGATSAVYAWQKLAHTKFIWQIALQCIEIPVLLSVIIPVILNLAVASLYREPWCLSVSSTPCRLTYQNSLFHHVVAVTGARRCRRRRALCGASRLRSAPALRL